MPADKLRFFTESDWALSRPASVTIRAERESQIVVETLVGRGTAQNSYEFDVYSVSPESQFPANVKTVAIAVAAGSAGFTLNSIVGVSPGTKLFLQSERDSQNQEVVDIAATVGNSVLLAGGLQYAYRVNDKAYLMDKHDYYPFVGNATGSLERVTGECVLSAIRNSPMQIMVYGSRVHITASGYWADIN